MIELSNRELEVVELLAQGYSNKEIGERLVISSTTVKSHINSVYRKLNIASDKSVMRIKVALWYMRRTGLIRM